MALEAQPQKIRNIGIYGLIRQAEVDDYLLPDGTVTEVFNFVFDRKGASTGRLGITALGSTISAGNACLGLYNTQSATLVASFVSGGSIAIYEWSGAAWNSLYTGTGGSTAARFVDFAGRMIFVSGLERSIRAWNGSGLDSVNASFDVSGNPINAQQLWYVNGNTNAGYIRPKYIEVYKSRVYLAGDSANPDRLYFSSVISSSGNLSWTPSTDFVDINPNDGENISALKRYSLELLVFKPNYLYRFRTAGIDPDPLIKIGTTSQESVIEGKLGVYFFHPTGFYRYSGGYPTEISRPISDIIANITYANYSNVASWKDSDHIYWFVGNIAITETRRSVTYNSVVLRYTESSDIWTMYIYPTDTRKGVTFNSGSALSTVLGTSTGVVATMDSGNTDLGEPIPYRLVTKWYEFQGIDNKKFAESIIGITDKAQGAHLLYQTDSDTNYSIDLGQMTDLVTKFNTKEMGFHRIRFVVAGVMKFAPPVFLGVEIP